MNSVDVSGARKLIGSWKRALAKRVVVNNRALHFRSLSGDTADQVLLGYESEIYEFIDRITPPSIFYDIGASIGNFSIYAATAGLQTFSFEPDPRSFGAMVQNLEVNGFRSSRAFQCAIADKTNPNASLKVNSKKGSAGDHHRVLDTGSFSGLENILSHLDSEISIQAFALDDLMTSMNLPAPDFMKIDIDGSESAFLKGAGRCLSSPQLKGVMIELCTTADDYPSIVDQFVQFGFSEVSRKQVYSSAGLEPGLFNVEFSRVPSPRCESSNRGI